MKIGRESDRDIEHHPRNGVTNQSVMLADFALGDIATAASSIRVTSVIRGARGVKEKGPYAPCGVVISVSMAGSSNRPSKQSPDDRQQQSPNEFLELTQ